MLVKNFQRHKVIFSSVVEITFGGLYLLPNRIMMLPHHIINVLVVGPHRFTFWSSIGTYHSGFMLKNLMMFTGFSCKSYAEQLLSELFVVVS